MVETSRPLRSTPTRPPRAFTLVELLVVLAVLSILIATLLPAIDRARDAGKLAVCLSNLHQASIATTTYANDFRDSFPPIWIPVTNNRSQIFWLGKRGYSGAYAAADATLRFVNVYLGKYTATSEVPVARCPKDEIPTSYGSSSFYNTHGSSYAANCTGPNFPYIQSLTQIGSDPVCRYGIRSSQVRDPIRTVLFAEFGAFDPVWNNVDPGAGLRWHDRNAITSATAFVGGNARLVYLTKGSYYTSDYSFDVNK